MTSSEFIAWFEGFTQRIRGRPSDKEWSEILARLGALDASSPLKAWFEGLRVKLTKRPDERTWSEIKKHIADEGTRTRDKKGRLQGIFETFEEKAGAIRGATDAKVRKKK